MASNYPELHLHLRRDQEREWFAWAKDSHLVLPCKCRQSASSRPCPETSLSTRIWLDWCRGHPSGLPAGRRSIQSQYSQGAARLLLFRKNATATILENRGGRHRLWQLGRKASESGFGGTCQVLFAESRHSCQFLSGVVKVVRLRRQAREFSRCI